MAHILSTIDIDSFNMALEGYEPFEIVRWAAATFGRGVIMSSSFGAESAVLLHLATRALPDIPVVFVDTGFLFPETHAFMKELRQRLDLNIRVFRPVADPQEYLAQAQEPDPDFRSDVARCCAVNKNEPFERAMRELRPSAWLRGIRRQQAVTRADRQILEWAGRYGCYAISPLLHCSTQQIHEYLKEHDLPYHPLYEKGYASIGCRPLSCTRPIGIGEDARAGRWTGTQKVECGLHLEGAAV